MTADESSEESDEKRRVIATCDGCEKHFVAWLWPDGGLTPVGGDDFCSCDEIQPRELDEETVFDDSMDSSNPSPG